MMLNEQLPAERGSRHNVASGPPSNDLRQMLWGQTMARPDRADVLFREHTAGLHILHDEERAAEDAAGSFLLRHFVVYATKGIFRHADGIHHGLKL
jgi:hypothetical protein